MKYLSEKRRCDACGRKFETFMPLPAMPKDPTRRFVPGHQRKWRVQHSVPRSETMNRPAWARPRCLGNPMEESE